MNPRATLSALLLSLTLGAAAPCAAQGRDRLELRVVTFNAWGLPWGLADDREQRIAALGPALSALRPHVVALQEVWVAEDRALLSAALAAAGLPHVQDASDGLLGSGLLVASAYPLRGARFTAFEVAGKLHKPWHGDAWARKGVLEVTLETPLGAVRVLDLHLHARYGSDEYLAVQLTQALQAVEAAGDLGAHPSTVTRDAARPPLVLAGDLNAAEGDLPYELLLRGAALRPVRRGLGIDTILLRPGGALALRARGVKTVLTDPVRLADGREVPLSDHPGLLATLVLERRPASAEETVGPWLEVASQARPLLTSAADDARARGATARSRGFVLLLVVGALAYVRHRRSAPTPSSPRRRAGCVLGLLVMTGLHLAMWILYLGVVHEPSLAAGLEAALVRLGE